MAEEIIKIRVDDSELQQKLTAIESKFNQTEKAAQGLGDETSKSQKKAANEVDDTTKAISKQGKEISGTTKILRSFGTALAGAFAVAKVSKFITEIGQLAIRMEQLDQKAKIVFGDALPSVTRESERAAIAIGLTSREFRSAAAGVADILVPMGFQRQLSADLAVETTKLAGAISNWSGGQYTAAEATQILQKALVGETEQLKSVGIVVDQTSKAFRDRIEVIQRDQNLTAQQAKAIDILRQVTEQSADAQQAFADGAENMAVQIAQADARAREAKEAFAEFITPALVAATNAYAGALESIAEVGTSNLSVFEKISLSLGALTGTTGQQNFQLAAIRAEAFAAKLDAIANDGVVEGLREINEELRKNLGLEDPAQSESIVGSRKERLKLINEEIETTSDQARLNELLRQKVSLENELNAILGKNNKERDIKIKQEKAVEEALVDTFFNVLAREDEARQQREAANSDFIQAEIDAIIDGEAKKREIIDASNQYQIEQDRLRAAITAEIAGNLFATLQTLAGDNAEAVKALSIFEATVNAFLAISSVLKDPTLLTVQKVPLALSIGALAFAQVAKIQSTEVPAFYKGTEYLKRGSNPAGRDTIPVMAHEGEAIIPSSQNAKYPGMAKAWIKGDLDKYITARHVIPALEAQRRQKAIESEAMITRGINQSINARLDDKRIVRELQRSRYINEEVAIILAKSSKRRNPYRA